MTVSTPAAFVVKRSVRLAISFAPSAGTVQLTVAGSSLSVHPLIVPVAELKAAMPGFGVLVKGMLMTVAGAGVDELLTTEML